MQDLMPIEHVADWEKRLQRQDAFWSCEIIDRPVVIMTLSKDNPDHPWPKERKHSSLRDRWMDTEYVAELALARAMNTDYLGDALPHAWPNLGPEVFAAFLGAPLEFGEDTSWSVPILNDWAEVDNIQFSEDNLYWKRIVEITDALLAVGRGTFYTGMTDFHPGGDAIAALRDPLQLNYDMIEHLDEVRSLLPHITELYFGVYDFFYEKLRSSGQAICTWAGIVSSKKWLVPSNDFSCMISSKMFDDVFLPSIAEECRHYEACLYHLDGPDALKHLDSLLSIEELSAIQWVYGAGHGRASDWVWVYQKCQAAGKGLQIHLELDELDLFMDALRPEGLWLSVSGVSDRDQAESVIKRIAAWNTRPS